MVNQDTPLAIDRADNPWQMNPLPADAPIAQKHAWYAFTILDALRDEIKANSPTNEPEDLSNEVYQADMALAGIQRACLDAVKGQTPNLVTVASQEAALDTLICMAAAPESDLARLTMVEPELGSPLQRLQRARRFLQQANS